MKLTFLGAADTVTGSKTLVEEGDRRLLVDCGLFQGLKRNRLRNWRGPGVAPASVDAVVLTHAHLDHSGYLPALVRDGFAGPAYVTPPTAALLEVLLPDAARLAEEDAAFANRRGFSRHHPALPLFREEDAERALARLELLPFGRAVEAAGFRVSLQPAGHILGAASARVEGGRTVLFSGDLGRPQDPLMAPPAPPGAADRIVLESTYGDRTHEDASPVEAIAAILRGCVERRGTLLIPSFAVGRTQAILHALHEAFEAGLAPQVPVYVDSPMAIRATEIFRKFPEYHRLSPDACEGVFGIARYARSADESREITASSGVARVVISASGMATGGRVLHHLRAMLPDPGNAVLFPGFQAAGTRGDALTRGAKAVKIHGHAVPVRAAVTKLDLLSAHADQGELIGWLDSGPAPRGGVLVNHGEPLCSDTLRHEITERLGLEARVPEHGERVELGGP